MLNEEAFKAFQGRLNVHLVFLMLFLRSEYPINCRKTCDFSAKIRRNMLKVAVFFHFFARLKEEIGEA